jgi:hypothetical protein
LFISLFVTGFGLFLGGVSVSYGTDALSSNLTSVFISESNTTLSLVERSKDQMLAVEESESTLFDRIGAFFRGGYDAVKLLFNSFGSISRLIVSSLGELSFLGGFGNYLGTILTSIVLVVIIVGILLNFLIKSDRT